MNSNTPAADALARFFGFLHRTNPVGATFTGLHDFDHLMPDWSPFGLEAAERDARSVDATLAHTRPNDDWEEIDLRLARGHLAISEAEGFGAHGIRGNPALWSGEAAFGLVSLMLRPFAPPAERAEALRGRLQAIVPFLDAARETMAERAIPPVWKERAAKDLTGLQALLHGGVHAWASGEHVAPATIQALDTACTEADLAAQRFAAFVRKAESDRDGNEACGETMLSLLLTAGHGTTRTPLELLRDAEERLTHERATLNEEAKAECGSWAIAEQRLAGAAPIADGFLSNFDRTWSQCRQRAIKHDVVSWPQWPVRYVLQPEWARVAAPHLYFLHYRSPAPYDDAKGHDYLIPPPPAGDAANAYYATWNHAAIKLNHVVHHGAIGHHVQNWHAYHSSRTRVGVVAGVDCANRIAMFCGGTMTEGWACYATELMEELEFLTPLESLSQQHSRVRFLGRAIADISLHTRRWNAARTVEFYEKEVGMTQAQAKNEVTKQSMFPGTGLMYWLGTQGILDLRDVMQKRHGAKFSLKTFHDSLLSHGSIPVAVVSQHMLGGKR